MKNNYCLVIFKSIQLLFLFCFLDYSSQAIPETKRKAIFDSLQSRGLTNAAEIFENGKMMLNYAKTDYEFCMAYHIMGDGKYKDGDFLAAIQLLEKADGYAIKGKIIDIRIAINSLLVYTYRLAGLPNESDTKLEIIKNITNKNKLTEYSQYLQARATALEIDKNFCDAIPIRTQEKELYLNKIHFDRPIRKQELKIFTHVHMAYLQIKCGNLKKAHNAIIIAEKTYEELGNQSPTYYIENYYLVKAIYALKQNQLTESRNWFDQSYESAIKTENKNTIKKILNEMRDSGLYTTLEDQNKISNALIELHNFQTNITKDVTVDLVNKKDKKLEQERKNKILIGTVLTTLCLGLILFIFFYRKRNRKHYARFEKIINEIENHQKKPYSSSIKTSEKKVLEIIKNNETEETILKNLESFEKKKQYNTPGISLAQMSVMLKTNAKYVSYILKKSLLSDKSTKKRSQMNGF